MGPIQLGFLAVYLAGLGAMLYYSFNKWKTGPTNYMRRRNLEANLVMSFGWPLVFVYVVGYMLRALQKRR